MYELKMFAQRAYLSKLIHIYYYKNSEEHIGLKLGEGDE